MGKPFAVIMAGGSGKRFWPLSRNSRPKQFLKLFSDKTLLEETIDRIRPLFDLQNIIIVCNKRHAMSVKNLINGIPAENILQEPMGRNTAPCIALAASVIKNRDADSVMCVLPADHFIGDNNTFLKTLENALRIASNRSCMITFGISPTRPHTGYGYIEVGDIVSKKDGVELYKVKRFVEKPDFKTAVDLLKSGNYFWNSGMFVWQTGVILQELKIHLPDILKPLEDFIDHHQWKILEGEEFEKLFSSLPSESIDYGVMEKSTKVEIIKGNFPWNDIGSWDALSEIKEQVNENTLLSSESVLRKSKNCILFSDGQLVACLGIENVVVVATPDAVLVMKKEHSQELKNLVEEIANLYGDKYL